MKQAVQNAAVTLTAAALLVSAFGYVLAPAQMLAVVGLACDPAAVFLVRALAAALAALAPVALAVRRRTGTRLERIVLAALGLYLVSGSLVDIWAWSDAIVGIAAVPSAAIRTGLGAILLWLALVRDR